MKKHIKVKIKLVDYEALYKEGKRIVINKQDLNQKELQEIGKKMYDRAQRARGYTPYKE